MKYVYESAAYGIDPVADSYWPTTKPLPELHPLDGNIQVDVTVIGAGFTGLSTAYHLAKVGVNVALVDAQYPTFGATGRNGGFCCLGGGKITNKQLDKLFGVEERRLYRQTEVAAVNSAQSMIANLGLDVDAHSRGETVLAHTAQRAASFVTDQMSVHEDYGVSATLHSKDELLALGMDGSFHGGLTIPIGFGLNPRKYALGILSAAMDAAAKVFCNTQVTAITPARDAYELMTDLGVIHTKRFVLATNAYSSEDLLPWMAGRFMPVQSSVVVTEQIPEALRGWTSDQMAYDTRFLLHYFRKLPNGRFLFGMRGGLKFTPRSEKNIRKLMRADFDAMFPKWRSVKFQNYWSGLVALNRTMAPYVGEIPGYDGGFAAFGYHGNGVAMASFVGRIVADLVQDKAPSYPYPAVFRTVPKRFPLGRQRRWLMAPIYRLMTAYEA